MSVTDLGNNQASALSLSITCAASVAAGNLVIAFVYDSNTTITGATMTDSKGNLYAQAVSQIVASSAFIEIWYSFITTPLTTSDTVTYTANNATILNMSVSAATGYTAIDNATTNSDNGLASTYSVTGAGTAAVANEINFGFVRSGGTLGGTPGGWTTSPPSSPNVFFLAAYQINPGTSPLTFNGTTGSANVAAAIVSFKPTPPPGSINIVGVALSQW